MKYPSARTVHFLTVTLGLMLLGMLHPSVAYAQAFSCTAVTQIPQAECDALVSLYTATNGTNWWDNSGWLVTNTPCDWYGITCQNERVHEIALGGNQLQGSLSSALVTLDRLNALSLEYNSLSGPIPPQLGDLYNLAELSLQGNDLSGDIPYELGFLESLQTLNLGDNALSGEIPESIGQLSKLQKLMLQNNALTGDVPATLESLTALAVFNFDSNQLSGRLPQLLQNLLNDEIDLKSLPEVEKAVKAIEDALPDAGNCGAKRIDTLRFNVETLEVSADVTIVACHSWGRHRVCSNKYGVPFSRDCDVKGEKTVTAKVVYNVESNRISGNLNFGDVKICDPFGLGWCETLTRIKVDLERLQRALEGDLVAAIELIPSPAAIETQTRNEYDRIRQSKWDEYGRENVYFASREFVNWASAAKSAQWAAELALSGGTASAAIMVEVKAEAIKEVLALQRWLQTKGVTEAAEIAEALLSGKSTDYPYIALKWQTVKYESRKRVVGKPVTPWIPVRHGAFYFVWSSDDDASTSGTTSSSNGRATVIAERLNVRMGPGIGYPVIGVLQTGQNVDISGQNSGWWQIRFRHSGGEFGWISGRTEYVTTQNTATVPTVAPPTQGGASSSTTSTSSPQPRAQYGLVNIVFSHSGKCVRVIDGDLRNVPTQIEQASCRPEYRFAVEPVPDMSGYYYIKITMDRGRVACLGVPDVVKQRYGNGAIKVEDCRPAPRYMWRIVPQTGANAGYNQLKIKSDEGFCLGVEDYENYTKQKNARLEDKRLITVNWCGDPWQLVQLRP